MRLSSRQILSREVSDWYHRGIITTELHDTLQSRYDKRGSMLASLLKWLGLFAAAMLGISILGVIGAVANSPLVGAIEVAVVGLVLGYNGRKLALDPYNRHPVVASNLLTLALCCFYGTLVLLAFTVAPDGVTDDVPTSLLLTALFLTAAAAMAVAYRFRLAWPLLFGLLLMFHGVGSWHGYLGHGTYAFDIQDPRAMAIIASVVALFGFVHERHLERSSLKLHAGFGHHYVVLGLLYCNMSLWILSLYPGKAGWVTIFALAAIAQIVLGARLKDGRATGFGVVFLSINIYTRFFETFWDTLSAGLIFLTAGLGAIGLGYLFEKQLRVASKEAGAQ